jgi:hypothetical protein
MSSLKILEIVATFEIDPILPDDNLHGSLRFRIEIMRDYKTGLFSPIVYRWETLRVQPTFPQHENVLVCDLADHEILVKDTGIDCDRIFGNSIQDALEETLEKLRTIFLIS